MQVCKPPVARAGLALLILLLLSYPSMAQQTFDLGASLAAVEAYDDNVFFSAEAPEPDNIWRLSPRLSFDRRSPRLTLGGRYGVDAEWFRRHPSLNTPLAAQDASFEMSWIPSKRWTATTTASYVDAQAAGALNVLTGLEVGRRRARRFSAVQAFSWQAGVRTRAVLEQSFTRELMAGFPQTDTQAVNLRLERRLGGLDRVHFTYGARRFDADVDPILSHVVTLGWTREVTSFAHFEFEAGPRLSQGTVGLELAARLRHRFARGEAGLGYVHTQTTVLGQVGPVTTRAVSATFRRRLDSLTLVAEPAFARVLGQGSEFDVYRINLEVAWRLTRRLSLSASHQYSFQRGMPGPAQPVFEIAHNAFVLRMVAASSGN